MIFIAIDMKKWWWLVTTIWHGFFSIQMNKSRLQQQHRRRRQHDEAITMDCEMSQNIRFFFFLGTKLGCNQKKMWIDCVTTLQKNGIYTSFLRKLESAFLIGDENIFYTKNAVNYWFRASFGAMDFKLHWECHINYIKIQ